jgi:hypothetical protein
MRLGKEEAVGYVEDTLEDTPVEDTALDDTALDDTLLDDTGSSPFPVAEIKAVQRQTPAAPPLRVG